MPGYQMQASFAVVVCNPAADLHFCPSPFIIVFSLGTAQVQPVNERQVLSGLHFAQVISLARLAAAVPCR